MLSSLDCNNFMPRIVKLSMFIDEKTYGYVHERGCGASMSTRLSEFNYFLTQPHALKFIIDDEFRATCQLYVLLESCSIFRATMKIKNGIFFHKKLSSIGIKI